VAAALLSQIRHDIRRQYGVGECRHDLLVKVQGSARKAMPKVIAKYLEGE
jgi:DNA polymerase-3 subunit epsilon